MASDPSMARIAHDFVVRSSQFRYSYNFSWLGRPIIQYPTDIVAMQEIIWTVRPRVIVETGIAHGGSLIFYASMLQLLGEGFVIGIDIDIRAHNRTAIENHFLFPRIRLIEGSALDPAIVARVRETLGDRAPVLVALDSNHTHAHVLEELRLYAGLVSKGSYLVVFDTVVEEMPAGSYPDRPWSAGNSPMTAVREFLQTTDRFEIDDEIHRKLLVTAAPSGFLRCVKD